MVLDNSLIAYLSDAAEHHGAGQQWSMVLLGNLGGRLRTAGRFLQFPRYNKACHRMMSNFYLSLLRAVGDNRETFGEPDRELADINTAGPLTEILALPGNIRTWGASMRITPTPRQMEELQ
jgi:hypothetical protein